MLISPVWGMYKHGFMTRMYVFDTQNITLRKLFGRNLHWNQENINIQPAAVTLILQIEQSNLAYLSLIVLAFI